MNMIPSNWTGGFTRGPIQTVLGRASASVRVAAQAANMFGLAMSNFGMSKGNPQVTSPDANLNDWFDAIFQLGDIILPDFLRSSRDDNKAAWEYLTAFFFGAPVSRGIRGYEDIYELG